MTTVTLTNADSGKSIEARPADEIVVRLGENPTTGYRWQVDRADGPLEQVSDAYSPDPDMQFGSGGTREFRFRASGPGDARLELKHWQAWEGEPSVMERFAADVRITG